MIGLGVRWVILLQNTRSFPKKDRNSNFHAVVTLKDKITINLTLLAINLIIIKIVKLEAPVLKSYQNKKAILFKILLEIQKHRTILPSQKSSSHSIHEHLAIQATATESKLYLYQCHLTTIPYI